MHPEDRAQQMGLIVDERLYELSTTTDEDARRSILEALDDIRDHGD